MRRCRTTMILIVSVVMCLGCTVACSGESSDERFTIVSYNVQNLFDAEMDGTEYPEYRPKEGVWDQSRYRLRVARVAEVIAGMIPEGADVVCLQEIEHIGVLEDLVSWSLGDRGFRYIAATAHPNSAIQVGVISKVPITHVRSHQPAGGIGVRPILEVSLRTPLGEVVCLINHWKSKIGGAEQTEEARIASAETVRRRSAEIVSRDPDLLLLCVGDLNECVDEQRRVSGQYPTALNLFNYAAGISCDDISGLVLTGSPADFGERSSLCEMGSLWFDPWLLQDGGEGGMSGLEPFGSHHYGGEWETIDHILCSEAAFDGLGWEFDGFTVVSDARLLSDDGRPFGWSLHTLTGYADHLPIILQLRAAGSVSSGALGR